MDALESSYLKSAIFPKHPQEKKKMFQGKEEGNKNKHLLSQRQQVHAFNITDPNKKTPMFSAPNLNPLFGELYALIADSHQ